MGAGSFVRLLSYPEVYLTISKLILPGGPQFPDPVVACSIKGRESKLGFSLNTSQRRLAIIKMRVPVVRCACG